MGVTGCFPTGQGAAAALTEVCVEHRSHRAGGASSQVEHGSFDYLPPFSLLSRCAVKEGQSSSKKMIYFSFALPPFHQDIVGKLAGDGLQLVPAR